MESLSIMAHVCIIHLIETLLQIIVYNVAEILLLQNPLGEIVGPVVQTSFHIPLAQDQVVVIPCTSVFTAISPLVSLTLRLLGAHIK